MDSPDHVLHFLRLFDSKGFTISIFLQVLLSSRQYADHPLVVDLVQSHSHIISLFCSHGAFEALHWVHESAEKEYQNEIQELVKTKNGWQFNALHASAEQIEMFRIEVMAEKMESLAPHLWMLLDKLLSATATKNRAAGTGFEIQETDDDNYWDGFDEIDLEGVINGFGDHVPQIGPQTHENKRLARHKAIITIVWKLISEYSSNNS
jgi:hypothetical protein